MAIFVGAVAAFVTAAFAWQVEQPVYFWLVASAGVAGMYCGGKYHEAIATIIGGAVVLCVVAIAVLATWNSWKFHHQPKPSNLEGLPSASPPVEVRRALPVELRRAKPVKGPNASSLPPASPHEEASQQPR